MLSIEDPTSLAPLRKDLPSFGNRNVAGQLANDRLAGAPCIAENDGSRRSSLGFIDAIFGNEGDPPGLGSVLGEEWEQELLTLRQAGGGPQAMEVCTLLFCKRPLVRYFLFGRSLTFKDDNSRAPATSDPLTGCTSPLTVDSVVSKQPSWGCRW